MHSLIPQFAGIRNITAVEYLTMAHIFGLNAAIMAHGRTIGWANEPPLNTNEYTLMQAGKEVCMTATYVARTVLAWWFWVSRYNHMLCSNYQDDMLTPQEPYVFFFWKVKAFGWFRIVSIVLLGASALHIPCVMVVLEESVASSIYCRTSMAVFVYCILGAELTLYFNNVEGAYEFNFDCVPEVLALLVGCKCFIWGALKPDREADPLVLLNSDASHRVPVSWPYAGVDLQGVCEVMRLAWFGRGSGRGRQRGSIAGGERGSGSVASHGGSATDESFSPAPVVQQPQATSAQQARQQNLTAMLLVPPVATPAVTSAMASQPPTTPRPPPQALTQLLSPLSIAPSPYHHPPAAGALVVASPPSQQTPHQLQPPLIQVQEPLNVDSTGSAAASDSAVG